MKKKIFVCLFIIIVIISIIIIFIKNNTFTSYITLADITILNQEMYDNQPKITFNIDDANLIKKYGISEPKKTYFLSDKNLYQNTSVESNDNYLGLTLKVSFFSKQLPKEEFLLIKNDPFIILSNSKYDQYITVTNLYK